MDASEFYGKEKISRILLKIAPPVMLAQLIQALYNIVDSLFVGKYSETGLTALAIIYPLQLLMIALAVGTGVGINTDMAYYFGIRQEKKAEEVAGIGLLTEGVWRTGHQLQLCGKRSGEMQSCAERVPDRGNGSDVSWNAVL